jgi:hypothetical protein
MPVHDWTRVDAGISHDFHNAWIAHLRGELNDGLLPPDYYAIVEQHAGRYIGDLLTLHDRTKSPPKPIRGRGGLAIAEVPSQVQHKFSLSESARSRRKTLALRNVSGDRLTALVEIVSPANKDRRKNVRAFVSKVEDVFLARDARTLAARARRQRLLNS